MKFSEIAVGDRIRVNGRFEDVVELVDRDNDNAIGVRTVSGLVWRLPDYVTQRAENGDAR